MVSLALLPDPNGIMVEFCRDTPGIEPDHVDKQEPNQLVAALVR